MPTEALSPADSRNYLGIGKQTLKGTPVAPTFFVPYVSQISFGHEPNIRPIREAGGGQTIARTVKDFIAPNIEFASPAKPDIAAALFAYFLGAAGAPTGAGPFVHTITPTPGAVWLTWERNISDDVIERIRDALIGTLSFDMQKRDSGPEIMIACTGTGTVESYEAAPSAESYEADRPWLRSDGTYTVDTLVKPNVESLRLDFTWTLDEAILANSIARYAIVKLHLECAIELVQIFDSSDDEDAYRSTHYGSAVGTEPGEVVYRGSLTAAHTYGAGAAERSLSIAIPNVDWGEAELTEPDPGASEAVRVRRAGFMVANPGGQPVTVTATNSRSTAYVA